MHAVCDPADHDASVWQHQEQCQNSHSLVRNRLVKTLPTVKTQGDVGYSFGKSIMPLLLKYWSFEV